MALFFPDPRRFETAARDKFETFKKKRLTMEKILTYYIEANGGRQYVSYDAERGVAAAKGLRSTPMPLDRIEDFVATAKELGMKAGRL